MRGIIYISILISIYTQAYGQWAKSVGGTSSDQVNGIDVDGSGNVYVAGYFSGTADFDPGSGTNYLTSAGSNDIFFAKYDSNGNLVWAKSVGGTSNDLAYGITVDVSGNVYVTGNFSGTADFDPGLGSTDLTSVGGNDIFFAKYNSNGDLVWTKSVGSSSDEYGADIAVDGSGNVCITGSFSGTADFDPGSGTANLTTAGVGDVYFAKYDLNGNYVWAKRVGSSESDFGRNISFDESANVYLTGVYYNNTVDFDPGSGIANLTNTGSADVFFAKYDSNGDYVWAKKIGGTLADISYGISVDGNGNVYVDGYFSGSADFDPGSGTMNLTSAGSTDIFFTKYDTNGDYVWAKRVGGTSADQGRCIALDGSGNVYVGGYFYETVDFDPGMGTANLTCAGYNNDGFFAKYDSNGDYVWAKNVGGTSPEQLLGIAVDGSGKVYVAGYFSGTADFDPGAGTNNITSAGGNDAFFAKYASDGALPVELTTFTASDVEEGIKLNWQTATEVNNYGFEVQRSVASGQGSAEFETLGFVEGHGNSNSPKSYEFIDSDPTAGKLQYRLKQIDTDGKYEYYGTIAEINFDVTDIQEHEVLPTEYSLSQNYPNPFNPSTTIKYSIPAIGSPLLGGDARGGLVALKVYDMLGREVATLVNEQQQPGNYEVQFDGRGLASGIYLYKLQAGSYSSTKKLMLLK